MLSSLASPEKSFSATLLLSNHPSAPEGVPNQFADVADSSDANDAPYYAFTLTAVDGDVEIVELTFTLSSVVGIAPRADFSDFDFGIDSDLDLDTTAEEQVENVVTATATAIRIDGFSSLRMTEGEATPFVLEMDVGDVSEADRFTIHLAPDGVRATSEADPVTVTGDSSSTTHIAR